MSVVVTKMRDLAYEFSNIFEGDTPGPSQWDGATPPASTPVAGRGAQRPGVGTQTLIFLNFLAEVASSA